jgi:signal transduction histidine kinase
MLVVDDEEGPRQSLRVIFKDDFNLFLATDGPSAIVLAQTQAVDVAVLDIRMAGMSGIEVLERLRSVRPEIEVVMMTAFETTDTMRQALRLRACDYINKPFDIATMRAAVATALERRSLSAEIYGHTQKLQALQAELQQQRLAEEIVRTRGEIYASILHDINGPLTIISGLVQMLTQRLDAETHVQGENLDTVKDRLKRIKRQVANCVEISRRYLSFLRQHPREDEQVWINQLLGDLRELVRVHPATGTNQLLVQPLPEDTQVTINGTDLIQILLNLTLNALQCKALPHRVVIRGQVLPHALEVAQFQDGPEDKFVNREGLQNTPPLLAISVEDNGPGIPPGLLLRIFEPYFTTQAHGSGTGLGLSIVERLLTQAGGGLHVHSRVGQGSIFTLYLRAHRGRGEAQLNL